MPNVGDALSYPQGPRSRRLMSSDGLEREIHHLGEIREWPEGDWEQPVFRVSFPTDLKISRDREKDKG